jgi:hypothetical protein
VIVAGGYDEVDVRRLREIADDVLVIDDAFGPPPRLTGFVSWVRGGKRHRTLYEKTFGAAALLGSPRRLDERREALEFALEGLIALRHRMYLRALDTVASDATEVLITDLRDVLFQADPFAEPLRGLEVFLEDASQRIGTCPFNSEWMRQTYGKDAVQSLSDKVVSCAGTTIGDRQSMIKYLTAMSTEVERKSRRQLRHVEDQGPHNWLIYTGRLGDIAIRENEHARVLTMGAMPSFERDGAGNLVNAAGDVPAIVHQYDRHRLALSDWIARYS